jgi:glycosyltransferase involved in cell wall biosynthesis
MDIDCVVIGLNTRATLDSCLAGVRASIYGSGAIHIIYVDGGSTDGSAEIAERHPGTEVIRLKPTYPSPGSQRNAGWRAGKAPLVMFLDSDTVVDPSWLFKAAEAMEAGVGAIRGRLTEQYPRVHPLHTIADLEWNVPCGDCDVMGGNAMVRREVLELTAGYDDELVGGEDPELGIRIRLSGWRILQIDEPMAVHDIAMSSLRQYWRRAQRTGYAYGAVAWRHGLHAGSYGARELLRIVIRAGGFLSLSCASGAGMIMGYPRTLLLVVPAVLLLLHPRLMRVRYFMHEKRIDRETARLYAWHCSLVVIPQLLGFFRFLMGVLLSRPLRNRAKVAA